MVFGMILVVCRLEVIVEQHLQWHLPNPYKDPPAASSGSTLGTSVDPDL
jgi:hypothetical protein